MKLAISGDVPKRTENAMPNPASASEISSAFSAVVYLWCAVHEVISVVVVVVV
jgi:hypothetical protein